MSYLLPEDYFDFIHNSINLDSNLIADYFISEYEKNKDKNIDFINQLSNRVYLFESVINKHQEFILMAKIDSDNFDYFNHVYPHLSYTDKAKKLRYSDLINITDGLKLFISRAEDNLPDNEELIINKKIKERTANKSIKIRWEGTQSQLYYEFRVLKENELILNNYDEIAEFIKENFTGFEKTSLNTIRTEIKRKINIVKPKRIQKPDEI